MSQFVFCQQEVNPTFLPKKEINKTAQMMEVLISPNPTIDKCIVQGEQGATCTLYSSVGTYIGKWVFDETNSLLLTDLPSGILQAIIEKNGNTIVKRIIVM